MLCSLKLLDLTGWWLLAPESVYHIYNRCDMMILVDFSCKTSAMILITITVNSGVNLFCAFSSPFYKIMVSSKLENAKFLSQAFFTSVAAWINLYILLQHWVELMVVKSDLVIPRTRFLSQIIIIRAAGILWVDTRVLILSHSSIEGAATEPRHILRHLYQIGTHLCKC